MNWTDGYHSETVYTKGLHTEQLPGAMRLVLALAGRSVGSLGNGQFRFCELGFGRGLTATAVAAAFPQARVYANDFNPSHVLEARALGQDAGLDNLQFFEEDFAAFAALDLPAFDVISLHGIYSWVSPKQRGVIREFVHRKLKPGGICYVSYNALPGWSSLLPLRRLVAEVAQGQTGKPAAERVANGMALLQALKSANAGFFQSSLSAAAWVESIAKKDPAYLSHELLNAHSQPEHFVDIARDFADIRLNFACSAFAVDHLVGGFLSETQRRLLQGIADPVRRETLRDFVLNQQFRRDLFQKGDGPLSRAEREAAMLSLRFARTLPAGRLILAKLVAYGELKLNAEHCQPVMAALQPSPLSVVELLAVKAVGGMGLAQLMDTLFALVATGQCAPALSPSEQEDARAGCDRLNLQILLRNDTPQACHVLVSPVTGKGVAADRVAQWFLLAGKRQHVDPVAYVMERLAASDNPVLEHDGQRMDDPQALRAEVVRRHQYFQQQLLPLYGYLQVV